MTTKTATLTTILFVLVSFVAREAKGWQGKFTPAIPMLNGSFEKGQEEVGESVVMPDPALEAVLDEMEKKEWMFLEVELAEAIFELVNREEKLESFRDELGGWWESNKMLGNYIWDFVWDEEEDEVAKQLFELYLEKVMKPAEVADKMVKVRTDLESILKNSKATLEGKLLEVTIDMGLDSIVVVKDGKLMLDEDAC